MTPSPVPTCGLRQTGAFLRDPVAFTGGDGLNLGDHYRVRIPGHHLHVVSDPDLVETILVRDAGHFVKGRIYWEELRRTMGDSMGALDGDRWAYLHRIQRPYFTPRAVEGYAPVVERRVQEYMSGLADEGPVAILDSLSELKAALVLSALFGQLDPGESGELVRRITAGNRIIDWKSKFPWRPLLGRINGTEREVASLREFFDGFLGTLKGGKGAHEATLLDALIGIGEDAGAPAFSGDLVRNEVMFHLGASTETQAAAEAWALYLLWRHPRVLARVREEVEALPADGPVTLEDIESLPRVRRVLNEALRLYPPVHGIVRECTANLRLGSVDARAGDTILISVYALHRSPRFWTEPTVFDPERFRADHQAGYHRYQYLPFGAGQHVCIGRHLAVPTMVLTLAEFVRRFEWSFGDGDVLPEARPSLKPSGPFVATLRARAR